MEEEPHHFSSCHVLLMLEIMQIKLMSTASSPQGGRARLPFQTCTVETDLQDEGSGCGRRQSLLPYARSPGARDGCLTPPHCVLITDHCSHTPPPSFRNILAHQSQMRILHTALDISPMSRLIKTPKHREGGKAGSSIQTSGSQQMRHLAGTSVNELRSV